MRLAFVMLVVVMLSSTGLALAQPAPDVERASEHFEQGEAFRKVGQYDRAIAEYDKAYALVPKPGFLFNIALCYEDKGDKRKALEFYERYKQDAPDGRAITEAKARASALADKIRAEDEAAEGARALVTLEAKAQELLSSGDHEGAVRLLRAARELSDDPVFLYRIAEVYDAVDNTKEALVHYETYLAAEPNGAHSVTARRRARELESPHPG